MYNSIYELEEEINDIIKIIYGVSFTDIDIINSKLKEIFSRFHWTNINLSMDEILDGPDLETIIYKFKNTINENIIELLGLYLYNSLITSALCSVKFTNVPLLFSFVLTEGNLFKIRNTSVW